MAAIVTAAQQDKFFTDLDAQRFWPAYQAAPIWYDRISSIIPCGTEQMLFGWIGRLDKMSEWLGSRIEHSPAPQTYPLVIQNWELTEAIDAFKLEDDTHGIYAPLVEAMGISTRKNPDYVLRDLIQNTGTQTGARQNGPDGTAGFGTSHPVDFYDAAKGSYINDYRNNAGVSSNGVTCGGPLGITAYDTVWADMTTRKSETGEAMGIVPDLLAASGFLNFTAKTLLQAEFLAPKSSYGATDNVGAVDNVARRGTADYLLIPEFGTATRNLDWLLLDTKKPLKPFIYLERKAPILTPRVAMTDPVRFDKHALLYGVEARHTVGWGPAFLTSISGPT